LSDGSYAIACAMLKAADEIAEVGEQLYAIRSILDEKSQAHSDRHP
jgi:hypothetical protein